MSIREAIVQFALIALPWAILTLVNRKVSR